MDREFRAIIVGIEDYDVPSTWKTLTGVRATASRIAKALGAVPLQLPDGGTKVEARGALTDTINAIPERSTLFVHWIGHGVTAGDRHYLVCRDSPAPDKLNAYEAIPSGELGRILAASKAERMVVVLDTCYSGEGAGNLAQRYREESCEGVRPGGMGARCLRDCRLAPARQGGGWPFFARLTGNLSDSVVL